MATPGDVAAILAEVSGSTQTIRAIAGNWTNAAESCGQQSGVVMQAAGGAEQGWTGTTAKDFQSSMTQFAAASSNEQDCFRQAAVALNSAAEALDDAQTTITDIYNALIEEAGALPREMQGTGAAFTASYNSAVSQMSADATTRAKSVASEAQHALTQAQSTLSSVLAQMKGSRAFSALYVPTKNGFTRPVPPYKNTPIDNARIIYGYLTAHGYSKYAAAGIVACIYGESTLDPEATGTGGWGLIGWTPQYPGQYADLYPTNHAQADLEKQLPAILTYNNGFSGYLPMLNSATSVQQAADIYSQNFERPQVLFSDVHQQGISIASQVSGL
jgi:uncharacterized protein YukE